MILLTDTQRDRLLANGRDRDQDHIPIVKFFNPFGAGVWPIGANLGPQSDNKGPTRGC